MVAGNRSIGGGADGARAWQAGLAVGVLTLAAYSILIAFGLESSRARFDAEQYHLVVVRTFAETWPAADISDYLSATAPGYHWLLAGVAQFGWSQTVLEIVGAVVAGLLTGLLGWWAARVSGRWWAAAAALPLMASTYVVQAGVSVLPDNAGWLGVLAVLLMCLAGPRRWGWVAVAAAMLALVLVRQSHIWVAGVVIATGWLSPTWTLLPARDELPARLRRTAFAVGAVLPAVVALGLLVRLWGGLAPPTFTGAGLAEGHPDVRASLSTTAPAYILMLAGIYGVFWARWWWVGYGGSARRALIWAAAGAAIGLALGFAGDSTLDEQAGRHGGYWRVIGAAPMIAERYSVLLVILSALGGAAVAVCGLSLPAGRRWILLLALAGFTAAQVVNASTWQRYYEPMVLTLLALASAECLRREADRGVAAPPTIGRGRAGELVALSVILSALTAFTLGAGQ